MTEIQMMRWLAGIAGVCLLAAILTSNRRPAVAAVCTVLAVAALFGLGVIGW